MASLCHLGIRYIPEAAQPPRRRESSMVEMTSSHIRLTAHLKANLQSKILEAARLQYDIDTEEELLYLHLQQVSEWYPIFSRVNAPWHEEEDSILAGLKECPWDLDNQQIGIILGRTGQDVEFRLRQRHVIMARKVSRLAWWPMRMRAWFAMVARDELVVLKRSFAIHLLRATLRGIPTGYAIPPSANTVDALLECAGIYSFK